MSQEKTFRISVPTLFERVNERRREQGLPLVEPAVMAVRASIKFAICQHKHIGLKGDLEMNETDADALCKALGELFNVDVRPGESHDLKAEAASNKLAASPSAHAVDTDDGATNILPIFEFYAAINRERRAKLLQPIEPAVISVRTGVKFSIMQRRPLDIRDNDLVLSKSDLQALESIVSQQFDVDIPGGLLSLCQSSKVIASSLETSPVPVSALKSLPRRLLGWLLGHKKCRTPHPARKVRRYSIDTSSLLLAIITRRAYLGYKPMTPTKVKQRFGEMLSAELELEVGLDNDKINLMPDQIDTFAQLIRKEFEIMFDDLDDLLGNKRNQQTEGHEDHT
jgi:hypothetical protein